MLEVWNAGTFPRNEHWIGRPPIYWLTGAGYLYSEGPVAAIWPGFLLPNLQESAASEEGFNTVLRAIAASGLPGADEVRIPALPGPSAGASAIELIFHNEAGAHRIAVEGLYHREVVHTDPRVPPLRELLRELDAIVASGSSAYRGDRVQVIVGFDLPLPEPGDRNDRPWPLPDPPARRADGSFPCHVFDGLTAAALLAVFGEANQATRWVWGEERLQLFPRPLLPGEPGCRA